MRINDKTYHSCCVHVGTFRVLESRSSREANGLDRGLALRIEADAVAILDQFGCHRANEDVGIAEGVEKENYQIRWLQLDNLPVLQSFSKHLERTRPSVRGVLWLQTHAELTKKKRPPTTGSEV